jgi:hypothetical protein
MALSTIGGLALEMLPAGPGPSPGALESAKSSDDARRWLTDHSPAEVDQALRTSLRSRLGVELQMDFEFRFPPGGGHYQVPVRSHLDGERVNFPAALAKVRSAMTPPTIDQAEGWLALLSVATAGARRSEAGAEATMSLYAAYLRRYPADVAKAACEAMATTSRWWPVLADLLAACDRLAAPRRVMLAALERACR